MNLVDAIKDQLGGAVIDKLSSLIGVSEGQAKSALAAALPALLSALSGKAASSGGADELASEINKFDKESSDKMTDMLAEKPEEALEQGNNLLGSLFGGSTLSALSGAISKFAGLDSETIKKLLGYVSPLVMGGIAKQFQGKPATAQGLTSLFDEQKENIADALPAGLSLASIPGSPGIGGAASAAADTAQETAATARREASSLSKTLLPIAALALLAFIVWRVWNRPEQEEVVEVDEAVEEVTAVRPVLDPSDAAADVSQVSSDLTSVFSTATETLGGITDVASAETALPELEKLDTQIDSLTSLRDKLPETAQSTIAKVATDNIGKLNEQIEKVLAIPGVGEKLELVLTGIRTKLKSFEGTTE